MPDLQECIRRYEAAQAAKRATPTSGEAVAGRRVPTPLRGTATVEPGHTFGAALRAFRLARQGRISGNRFGKSGPGVSQSALARAAGVNPAYVCLLESGRRPAPSYHVVDALARALGLNGKDTARLFKAAGYRPPGARRVS